MRRIMKKYISLLIILASVIVLSCTKEQASPEESLIQLVFTGITEDTKTALEDDFTITWSTDDDITVFPGASAAGVKFDVSETSDGGHNATFTGSAAASDTYYALSPAQNDATISGGIITATLPTTQTAVSGSFGPEANVSVATASDFVFRFKNVGALVGLTIGNDGITGVKLEALGGEVLTGSAVIDPADGSLQSKSGKSYAQLSGSFTNGDTYYFVVLPGTYSGGFRITLYKGAQYTRFTKSAEKTIGRNDNLDLGSYTGSNWKTAFSAGEGVKIKGSAEDGQDLAYVASSGYWNSSIQYSDVNDYPYNYEIFTSLTQDQKFYFEADGGEKFTLNAAGNAIEPLTKIANAPYGAPSTGLYRIRMVLPDGSAEIKQISEVKYDIYGYDSRVLSYLGNGEWGSDNFVMKSSSYMNRYRFIVKFTDDTKQYYGRMSTVTGNPTYGVTSADYFYVQPTIDSSADHWSPCFKFQNETSEERYYCTMTLSMNNDNGHYTHSVTNLWDRTRPISSGENVFVQGSGVASPDVAGTKMRYSTAFYNSSVANYGDRVDGSSTMADPAGYDYEVFIKLSQDTKFYFSTESGHNFAINSTGNGIEGIFTESEIGYSGVSNGGVYRIRINSITGEVALKRAESARYLQPNRGTNQELSYIGNGTWRGHPAFGWTNPSHWGSNSIFVFKFQIYYNETNTWQYYGRYETASDYTSTHIQPITDTGATSSWDNFLTVENHPVYGAAQYQTEYGYCDMYLKLNADGYTYAIENIRQ